MTKVLTRSVLIFLASIASHSLAVEIPPDEVAAEIVPRYFGTKPLPPMPDDAFTVVVIPDTQAYTGKGTKKTPKSEEPVTNRNLMAQIDWIIANHDEQKIAFVSHVGDIVEYDRAEEWVIAKANIDRLRGIVPFSLTVGNHDMNSKGDAHLFQEHFPAVSFESYPWYLESYQHDRKDQNVSANNVNSAQLFSAGGVDFIHLSLECNAPDDVLTWADRLFRKYRDRCGLVTTHMDVGILNKPTSDAGYIHDAKGRMRWGKIHGKNGNTGQQMWEELFCKQPNLAMIFCGDQSRVTALRLDTAAEDGHIIPSMLSDYQSEPVLRLLRFFLSKNRVQVLSYEVRKEFLVEKTNYVSDIAQHQFELEVAFPIRKP